PGAARPRFPGDATARRAHSIVAGSKRSGHGPSVFSAARTGRGDAPARDGALHRRSQAGGASAEMIAAVGRRGLATRKIRQLWTGDGVTVQTRAALTATSSGAR